MADKDLVIQFQRIRHVKPEFFSHEGLFEAEEKTGLPVRLGFIGLWTVCDKHGRFEWRPRQLKVKTLPYDQVDFGKILEALEGLGSVKRYSVNGKDYGYIPSWRKHQYISPKEHKVKSSYPAPPGIQEEEAESSDESHDDSEEGTVPGPTRTGTEAAPERYDGVKNGNGNGLGKEWETKGNGNVECAVGTGIRSPIPLGNDSSSKKSNAGQSHSQSQPEPIIRPGNIFPDPEDIEFDVRAESDNGPSKPDSWTELEEGFTPAKPQFAAAALRLAKAFYDTLPEENQSAAPRTWQTLWAEDFAGLLEVEDEACIMDIITDYRRTKKAKYIVRAQTFVEMFDDVAKAVNTLRNATAAGRIKADDDEKGIVVRHVDVEEL